MALSLSHNAFGACDRVVLSGLTLSCVTLQGYSLTFLGTVFPVLTVLTMTPMVMTMMIEMMVVVIMMMMTTFPL